MNNSSRMLFQISFLILCSAQYTISVPTSKTTRTTSAPLTTSILENEFLSKVMHAIPHEKITEIANAHLKSDENFQAAVKYLQNETFLDLMETIEKKPEWTAFRNIVKEDTGLDISSVFKCVVNFLRSVKVDGTGTAERSFKPFIMDVFKEIPFPNIMAELNSKENASKFEELYNKMSSAHTKKIVANLIHLPEVKKFLDSINDMDLKVYDLLAFIFGFLKWGEIQIPSTYETLLVQLS
ncbi:unnamed protein product [Phaedon cochleariae]|uniref:Uncharacterized protein n=1 Tax=Phaedon cochleariae TaxID=80249 RepID=A0A9P0DSS7_PHACE|nr:unnamed protein product [Phaedon cochleariae]